jgi:hypothetical protein
MHDQTERLKETIGFVQEALQKLSAAEPEHELLRWQHHFFNEHTCSGLFFPAVGFTDCYKKCDDASQDEILTEYLAEVEEAESPTLEPASPPKQRSIIVPA